MPSLLLLRLTTSETALKNKRETLEGEEKAARALQAAIQELAEQDLPGNVGRATTGRDGARAGVEAAEHAVEAATRELAGEGEGGGIGAVSASPPHHHSDASDAAPTHLVHAPPFRC